MAAPRLGLSDRSVAALPLTDSGQVIVRDKDLPGFFVVVGTRSKTYMVQGDLWVGNRRQSIRAKIGDGGRLSAREARAKAKIMLGSIANGVDPRREQIVEAEAHPSQNDPSLREAWESYRESHMQRKGRSKGTIENYRDHVERLLEDWSDQKLSIIGNNPAMVKARHDKLTTENGPYIANGCMRSLRAIYNHARKTSRALPAENPVLAVDWNSESRRNTAMGLADLGKWFEQLSALGNLLRREFHLFLLLSGSRPDSIKRSRIWDLDLRRRTLHISKPKGGEKRAFDIPLSREMIRCIIRAIRLGRQAYPTQAQTWLFPADSKSGHIVEHKENRVELTKWGNDLRQTYRTVGQAACVNEVDMHLLMNHSMPGINTGYITRRKLLGDHLRTQQQKISSVIFEAIRINQTKSSSLREWLGSRAKNRV